LYAHLPDLVGKISPSGPMRARTRGCIDAERQPLGVLVRACSLDPGWVARDQLVLEGGVHRAQERPADASASRGSRSPSAAIAPGAPLTSTSAPSCSTSGTAANSSRPPCGTTPRRCARSGHRSPARRHSGRNRSRNCQASPEATTLCCFG
jgi:hypothetical protein